MLKLEMKTLEPLRKMLIEYGGRVKVRRFAPGKAEMRERLDETLLAFRVARRSVDAKTAAETGSWLRAVRQAVGVPVDTMAAKLGVTKHEIFRMEKAERESRIVLGTLMRAAEALDCVLVYALTPKRGSLEDLAAMEEEEREQAREKASAMNNARKRKAEDWLHWRAGIRQMFRREMRKMGLRVR